MEIFSNLSFEAVIAFITIANTLLIKLIGFPSQAVMLHKNKSTKGVSTTLFALTFSAYIFWTIHGLIKHDIVLIIGQGIGIIASGIILGQIIYYRSKNKKLEDAAKS
ncbi:MAG: SemiSWEET family transporter [Ignavibacteriaceae bacterium]